MQRIEKMLLTLPFEEFEDDEVEVKFLYTPPQPQYHDCPAYDAEVEITSIKHRGEQVVATVSREVIEYIRIHVLENFEEES